VTSIDPEVASATLSSGEVISGDIVIGADGVESMVRDLVLGHHDDGVPTGTAVYV
jgi:salicylate hydroxylase